MCKLNRSIRIYFKIVNCFQSLSCPAWVDCDKKLVGRPYSVQLHPRGYGNSSAWLWLKFRTIYLNDSVLKLGSSNTIRPNTKEGDIVLDCSTVFMLRIIINNNISCNVCKAIVQRGLTRLPLICKIDIKMCENLEKGKLV